MRRGRNAVRLLSRASRTRSAGRAAVRRSSGARTTDPTSGSIRARYPGDAAMQSWREHAGYDWVGFYLPAPCHKDESWSGKRETIERMGWGVAVVYVGQQTWGRTPRLGARVPAGATCATNLVTPARGRIDADDAIARSLAEGFAFGTAIFLDLEHMDTVPNAMREYYLAWTERRARGRSLSAGVLCAHAERDNGLCGRARAIRPAGRRCRSAVLDRRREQLRPRPRIRRTSGTSSPRCGRACSTRGRSTPRYGCRSTSMSPRFRLRLPCRSRPTRSRPLNHRGRRDLFEPQRTRRTRRSTSALGAGGVLVRGVRS